MKRLRHPIAGPIVFEYSAFAVDGRPYLEMAVDSPTALADAERIADHAMPANGSVPRPLVIR
jgi:hypothetical protein